MPQPDRRTVHGGDHRDVGREERQARRRHPRLGGEAFGRRAPVAAAHHLADVVARAERRAGARDHEAACRRALHRVAQRREARVRERVSGRGSVDGDDVDVAAALDADAALVAVAHARTLTQPVRERQSDATAHHERKRRAHQASAALPLGRACACQ